MTLFSRIYGQGDALIILHGLFGTGDNWVTLARQFAQFFEVHVIDQRNHGHSFHSENWDYHNMVQDLEEYIAKHNLGRVKILGHSMGGKTAMNFACFNPGLTDALIVADIAPKYYPAHHQAILEAMLSVDFKVLNTRKLVDEHLQKYIPDFSTRQFLLKALHFKTKDELAFRFNLKTIAQNIENVGEPLSPNAFYDGPTLFLRGDKSNYIKDEDSDLIFTHFHDARLVDISNAGHWLHAENPQMFFDECIKFLKP